jgi:hypothetical protein
MLSRRQLGRAMSAAFAYAASGTMAAAAAPVSSGGVKLGVCVGSYRDIPRTDDQAAYIAALAKACADSGAGLLEYHNSQLEPAQPRTTPAPGASPTGQEAEALRGKAAAARNDLRRWRLETPVSYFDGARRVFEAAGASSFAYSFYFTEDMTDAEIDTVFLATKALGCGVISTNGTKVSMGQRLSRFAERHRIDLGFHNHSAPEQPNEVASLESFETLLAISPRCKANLDIGHLIASNLDPITFIKAHHSRITHLHFKDRKRDKGANLPWGQGDTPLKDVLLLVKRNRYPIPCLVEYEYYNSPGNAGSVAENRKCLEFMRKVLA